ncbi:hypothetical protein [Halorhabdus sp. SVX81]|uniref:hypothetical protein n=1 Tax=Halorhabdus sp. SVX81 TaxID=2978283 RepID=UPI0023DB388F|nr:hypothetical protein [Halorhabdus sp. SVX81]
MSVSFDPDEWELVDLSNMSLLDGSLKIFLFLISGAILWVGTLDLYPFSFYSAIFASMAVSILLLNMIGHSYDTLYENMNQEG